MMEKEFLVKLSRYLPDPQTKDFIPFRLPEPTLLLNELYQTQSYSLGHFLSIG